jgi:hypothetical protein
VPDISAIAAIVSSLNSAKDIAQTMIGLRDAQAIQAKVLEFQAKLLDANSAAFTAQDERAALLKRVGELETEVAHLKDWEADKKRYQLSNIGNGVVALALKPAMSDGEPTHYLCADCAAKGKKAYLQPHQRGTYYEQYKCNGCGFDVGIDKGTPPQSAWQPIDDDPGDDFMSR